MTDHKFDFHILPTKLNRPIVDERWVPRPRLIIALYGALNKRVMLLSAPAGYGKTTLVAQWLDHNAMPSAWLSLDRHDGDPDRFLKYLTASLRSVFPDFGPALEALLSAAILPPLAYLADALIGELTALDHPLVIVLDDFHHFVSESVLQLLARLVQFQPEHLHLVISTRVDPDLPLSQWRVRNWLVELRAASCVFEKKRPRPISNRRSHGMPSTLYYSARKGGRPVCNWRGCHRMRPKTRKRWPGVFPVKIG